MQAGEIFSVIGPLGNGFPLDQAVGKKVFLIGGGIGIPPMLESAKQLYEKNKAAGVSVVNEIVLGYRSDLFLAKEFEPYGHVVIATEDGNGGTKGTVLDAICEQGLSAEMIFSCGPKPMLRALKAFSEEQKIPCQVSMEERMACGVGACLGCVTRTVRKDEHSQVNNVRVCKDGPVFDARDIVL
jgi:dihydroorotate dehydrogenase electron transfer subunit